MLPIFLQVYMQICDTHATALLHDVIHKGNSTIEEVQKNFSKEISTLVEGNYYN